MAIEELVAATIETMQQGDAAVVRRGTNPPVNVDLTVAPPNVQTGTSYTPVLNDAVAPIIINSAVATMLPVPLNSGVAFPVGTYLVIMAIGIGITTVSVNAGATLNGIAGGSCTITGKAGTLTLFQRAANTWLALNRDDVA